MSLQIYLTSHGQKFAASLQDIEGYNPGIHPSVIDKINVLNQEKGPNSPMVLVLRSTYDEPPILSNSVKLSQLAHFAKNSRVFIQTITDKGQIQPMISAAKKAGKIQALIISTHATHNGLRIRGDSFCLINDINESHFKDLPVKAPIIIDGCLAGKEFAPELAKKIQRTVHGAISLTLGASSFYFCPKHQSFEITDEFLDSQPFRIFKPDGSVEEPCASYLEKIPQLISIMSMHFTHWHQASDYCSYMGLLYERQSDFQRAYDWYLTGARSGEGLSQNCLGYFFEYGIEPCKKNEKEAFKWYQRAANLKIGCAQFSIGKFFEQGLGGCPKNLNLATQWYQSAAMLKSSNAEKALVRLNGFYCPFPTAPMMLLPTNNDSTSSSSSSFGLLPSASLLTLSSDEPIVSASCNRKRKRPNEESCSIEELPDQRPPKKPRFLHRE